MQMIYAGIDTRNKRHARVEASKICAFKFLKQRLVERHCNSILASNTPDVVRATIIAFMVSFLAALLAFTIFFMFEPFGLNILFVILRLLLSAFEAINCFIISFSATIAKSCCITLFSDADRPLRSPLCCFRGTLSASNSRSIFTTRIAAIFAQSCVNTCLLCLLVSHISLSIAINLFRILVTMESIAYGRGNIKHIANTLRKNVQSGVAVPVVKQTACRTDPFT